MLGAAKNAQEALKLARELLREGARSPHPGLPELLKGVREEALPVLENCGDPEGLFSRAFSAGVAVAESLTHVRALRQRATGHVRRGLEEIPDLCAWQCLSPGDPPPGVDAMYCSAARCDSRSLTVNNTPSTCVAVAPARLMRNPSSGFML